MAQLAKMLILLFCEFLAIISANDEHIVSDANFNSDEISQYILDFLNTDAEPDHHYHSASIIGIQKQNGSEHWHLLTATVSAQCQPNASSSCVPAHLVCEVLLNSESGSHSISHKLCAPQEQDAVPVTGSQGFRELDGEEKTAVSENLVSTLEAEDPRQLHVVDILSVKKWNDENGTKIYLTVKATMNNGGDTPQFVVCELVNGTEDAQCFPLEAYLPDFIPDGENMTEVAKAVELLNELSSSRYIYILENLQNIDKVVTPGSNGVLTTLKVVLTPTLCLKRSDDDIAVERQCSSVQNSSKVVCTLTLWDRPWEAKKFIHSIPVCHLQELVVASTQRSEVQDPMINYRQPVVEEPIIVRHTYCVGCPTPLNLDTPAVQELAEQSLNLLDEGTGSIYKHALVRVVKAEKQVVNGVKYNIYLDVGESSCLKGSPEDRTTCPLNNLGGDAVRTCHFEFTEKTWLRNGRQLTDSNCTTIYTGKTDNNELENEIEPHSLENAVRQSIYDYLDAAMEEPSYHFKEISPSFRDDSDEAFFSSPKLSLIDDEIVPDTEASSIPFSAVTVTEAGPTVASLNAETETVRRRRETTKAPSTNVKNIDDTEREYIEQLAYQAVETLDEIDADDNKRVVHQILEAKKQLVDGIMYHLKLRVGSSACKEDVKVDKDCLQQEVAPVKICDVQLHKAFANTSPKNVQVVKAECFIEPSSASRRRAREDHGNLEESPADDEFLEGGYQPVADLNSDNMKRLVGIALAHLDSNSEDTSKTVLVSVDSAEVQVVSGLNNKLHLKAGHSNCSKSEAKEDDVCVLQGDKTTKKCTVVIFEQSWTQTIEVTEATCEPVQGRRKRAVGLLGGYRPVKDLQSNNMNKLVGIALSHLDGFSQGNSKTILVKLESAESQLVSGTNTKLHLEVGPSNCSKSEVQEGDVCVLQDGESTKKCTVVIYEQPWTKTIKVTDASCDAPIRQRIKRRVGLAGGYNPVEDLNSESINKTVDIALSHLDSISGEESKLLVVEVKEAQRQVVAGFNTKLKLLVGPSNCTKSQANENNVCVLTGDQGTKECTVVVFEQAWANTTEVKDASCDTSRVRRQVGLPGGYNPVEDLNSESIKKTADIALAHLDGKSSDDSKLVIVEVKEAKRQVVAGINTELKIVVGTSNCSKSQANENDVCVLTGDQGTKECTVVVFEQAWTNTTEVTEASCGESRVKRRVGLAGGYKPVEDLNSESMKITVDIALSHLDSISGEESKLLVVEVKEAQRQVVAGINTKVKLLVGPSNCTKSQANENNVCVLTGEQGTKECTVVVFEQAWTNTTEVKNASCDTSRVRRQAGLPGGYNPVEDLNSESIKKTADIALAHLDGKSSDDSKLVIVEVKEAKRQVVAGINTELKIVVGVSNCSKTQANENDVCVLTGDQGTKECTVVVFEQAWTNTTEVTEASCGESKVKRQIPGGYNSIDMNSEVALKAARMGLSSLQTRGDSTYKMRLIRIIEAQQQIVGGTNTKVTFEVGITSCLHGNSADSESCPLDSTKGTKNCTAILFSQPWMKTEEISSVMCDPAEKREASHRRKRLLGASAGENVGNATLQEMANFALAQIDKQSNNLYSLKLIDVLTATTQEEDSTLYSLNLRVGYSTCRKSHSGPHNQECKLRDNMDKQICSVEISDNPSLNERKLKSFKCTIEAPQPIAKRNSKIGGGTHDIHLGLFKEFMTKHNKKYNSREEMKRRFHIFRANMKKVQLLKKTEQGTAKYGPTRFADMTPKEFKAYYTGLNLKMKHENNIPMTHAEIPDVALPKEFDWRHYNVVTEVKNQGSCGSCWAFSVTGNVEGQYALRTGNLVSFSEQELVDCDTLDEGCNGGLPDNAYRAIDALGGLETEKDYPYEGESEKCHFNRTDVMVQVRGGLNISSNETKMAQWLVKNGPISIGINANAMQFYMGGISHPWKFLCNADELDHGVLIVGYGVHTYPLFNRTMPFWTIKNSWGELWGEQGYYRVFRGDGTCGVNQMASSAILD